jgi:hypothetical protein
LVANILSRAEQRTIPSKQLGGEKGGKRWWNADLRSAKERLLFWRFLWIEGGKPVDGHVYHTYRRLKAHFKLACKAAIGAAEDERWASLLDAGDPRAFWRGVSLLRSGRRPANKFHRVDGANGPAQVASLFAAKFMEACSPPSMTQEEADERIFQEQLLAATDVDFEPVSVDHVRAAIAASLKRGKSRDIGGLVSEQILEAIPLLAAPLSDIFTAMLRLSHVPPRFRTSAFTPLPKGAQLDCTKSENFRGIAVAPVLMRILEAVLRMRCGSVLTTCERQFAYKVGSSTSKCVVELLDVLQHFHAGSTPVHLLGLDVSKAFDKVIHPKLCTKLLERGMHALDVRLLHATLVSATGIVRTGGACSTAFPLRAGVRQGSILGGTLWTVYIDQLLLDLTEDAVGCQMSGSRGVFAFADDMTLLSPTLAGLRRMFSTCERYFSSHQIQLNRSKPAYRWRAAATDAVNRVPRL